MFSNPKILDKIKQTMNGTTEVVVTSSNLPVTETQEDRLTRVGS
jgi:hypothetical protein